MPSEANQSCNAAAPFDFQSLPMLVIALLAAFLLAMSCTPPATAAETDQKVSCDLSALRARIDAQPAGTWIELTNTEMRRILLRRDDPATGHGVWGASGSEGVIKSWNGAAFNGCEWYFSAGGHMNYGGNEVYRFSLVTLEWQRLTDPTPYLPATRAVPCVGTTDINKPCLSGCHPHPLNVGCTHSPEYSPSKVGAAAPPAIPSSERNALNG